LKPEQWGSPLVQEKYREGKACDRRHPYRVIIIIIIIIMTLMMITITMMIIIVIIMMMTTTMIMIIIIIIIIMDWLYEDSQTTSTCAPFSTLQCNWYISIQTKHTFSWQSEHYNGPNCYVTGPPSGSTQLYTTVA